MFGAIAGGIASALAGGAMSKLFGGGQKAASGGIQGDVLATDNNTVGMGDAGIKSAIQGLSLRSSRSSYFATFRHQLTILSKTDALDEEKWLNMLGTFVKDWFRYESHFVHGRDSLVDILKERGLLSESDAVQPLIGKKS